MSKPPSTESPRKRPRQQEPIPDFLVRLGAVFERANTFCAFCDARLTTALTLDKILSSVNDMQLRDLAGINAMLPNFIHYYKEDAVTVVQFGKPLSKQTMREKHSAAMASRGDDWQFKQPRPVKPEAIQKTIQSRNKQFHKAVTVYLNKCKKEVRTVCILRGFGSCSVPGCRSRNSLCCGCGRQPATNPDRGGTRTSN